MESDGWIYLNRNILRSWIWTGREAFCTRAALVDIYFKAAYREHKVYFCDQTVELKRGQLVTSGPILARAWGWSDKKVRNWLKKWEKAGIIKTIRSDYAGTLLEVCNYEFYQDPKKATPGKGLAKEEPTPTPRPTSNDREKERKESNPLNENKIEEVAEDIGKFRCGWGAGNKDGSRCALKKLRTSIYCSWHDFNAAGGSPPREPDNRELFNEWLKGLGESHPWNSVNPDEIWDRAQGESRDRRPEAEATN